MKKKNRGDDGRVGETKKASGKVCNRGKMGVGSKVEGKKKNAGDEEIRNIDCPKGGRESLRSLIWGESRSDVESGEKAGGWGSIFKKRQAHKHPWERNG